MSWMEQADTRSCVLLRLGERRFALAADQVAELAAPSRVFRFAHRTPEIEGVILRRGRVVPVCDIAEKLTGKRLGQRRFIWLPHGVKENRSIGSRCRSAANAN